jgi:hypothetical protein
MKIIETALRAALLVIATILAIVVVSTTSDSNSPFGGLCILILTIFAWSPLAWRLVSPR